MSREFVAVALLALAAASPIDARPLEFGTVDGRADLSGDDELTACASGQDGAKVCALRRTSFGGLPINRSEIALNADGRATSLSFWLDRADREAARQLLVGRYGAGRTDGAATRWSGFDDGAEISIAPDAGGTKIQFAFPGNRAVARRAGVDTDAVWSLLAFCLAGIGLGLLIQRSRRPVRREPSMRDVLERRMREGRDLQF